MWELWCEGFDIIIQVPGRHSQFQLAAQFLLKWLWSWLVRMVISGDIGAVVYVAVGCWVQPQRDGGARGTQHAVERWWGVRFEFKWKKQCRGWWFARRWWQIRHTHTATHCNTCIAAHALQHETLQDTTHIARYYNTRTTSLQHTLQHRWHVRRWQLRPCRRCWSANRENQFHVFNTVTSQRK